jgi:uncharacterized protein YqgC (DUF456 family)
MGWVFVIGLFILGMVGTVYPILPSALAIFAAFFVYGWFYSFASFGFWFWSLQVMFVIAIVVADFAVSAIGVKKFGGSKASMIGNTIGVLIGPWVIPFMGILIGPFIGAVVAEVLIGTPFSQALRIGVGSVLGFFSSTVVKIVLQSFMIILFLFWIT